MTRSLGQSQPAGASADNHTEGLCPLIPLTGGGEGNITPAPGAEGPAPSGAASDFTIKSLIYVTPVWCPSVSKRAIGQIY